MCYFSKYGFTQNACYLSFVGSVQIWIHRCMPCVLKNFIYMLYIQDIIKRTGKWILLLLQFKFRTDSFIMEAAHTRCLQYYTYNATFFQLKLIYFWFRDKNKSQIGHFPLQLGKYMHPVLLCANFSDCTQLFKNYRGEQETTAKH